MLRRGACPGLSRPLQTGDGLLARLMPIDTIPLAAFAELCAAARAHGNGIIEITGRGSIQVRGLSAVSAPRFAAAIAGLGIAAEDGIPVLTNALAGLDPDECLDAGALAADLRRTLARGTLAARLAPKVSVAIDGGGALALDALSADVRLCAETSDGGGVVLRVGVSDDGTNAAQLGLVAPAHGIEAATRLLEVLARRGHEARARDIIAAEGAAPFRLAISDLLVGGAQPRPRRESREAIGLHRLRDGSLACGIGLAFSHADAPSLERLAAAAAASAASGVRAASDRTLMTIGLTRQKAPGFVAAAERLGFIVRADDPRRHVVACAGAPICAAAEIPARALAPLIAAAAAPVLDRSFTIHVSGCAKGCARSAPAALTIVGTRGGCTLIADGAAGDIPFAVVATEELTVAVARHAQEAEREGRHV